MQSPDSHNRATTVRCQPSPHTPYLRLSEQPVTPFLLNEGADTADWTLESLVAAAHVGPSAIVRTSQATRLGGFHSFVNAPNQRAPTAHPTTPNCNSWSRLRNRCAKRHASWIYGQGGSGHMACLMAASLTIIGRLGIPLADSERDAPHLPAGDRRCSRHIPAR